MTPLLQRRLDGKPYPFALVILWTAIAVAQPNQTQLPNHPQEPLGVEREEGIPVTDPLVIAKCGTCHVRDERGNLQGISYERSTPEGWQDAMRRMILAHGVTLTPPEARAIVRYLSASHGLAPAEVQHFKYDPERRAHEEIDVPDTGNPNTDLRKACTKCHAFSRVMLWRRSARQWRQFGEVHASRHNVPPDQGAAAYLATAAPLHTPEWDVWSARTGAPDLAGRWLAVASIRGRGSYYGDMRIERTGDGEFTTTVNLTSVKDGSRLTRSGRSVVYAGYAWRGRSQGGESIGSTAGSAPAAGGAPDDVASEAREVLWIAPDQAAAEGRWFWGQYQEFGFDVKIRRASAGPALLLVDRPSMKVGSKANRIRLIGDNLPAKVSKGDLNFGPGVMVRRIVSSASNEIVAEVDVAADAPLGKRAAAFRHSVLPDAFAVYDRVDYVKVTPESSLAAFADKSHPRGYQQYDAVGYQRGADGKLHTADDVELGPVDVTWSLEVFYATPGSGTDFVGTMSPSGFFTPAADSPNNNFDVWVVATAAEEKDRNGKPLVGKSYLVVTVPMYTFNGRQYVRDLDRWVDDGPAQGR